MATKKISDVDGEEAVTPVLKGLLNSFPGFSPEQKVSFATLGESSGIAMFPVSGGAVEQTTEDILGHVQQVCAYPFSVVYRTAPNTEVQRTKIKELLDALGRGLERQTVTLDSKQHRLDSYPELDSGNRKIKSISRTSAAFLNAAYQDGIEDWMISARLTYNNEFDR